MHSPDMWGLIPKGKRRPVVSLLMLLIHASQIMAKTLSFALLAFIGAGWLGEYIVIDYGLYLCYKLFRDDTGYWAPVKGYKKKFVLHGLLRLMCKLLSDFSGNFMTRHPYELGGAYYSLNSIVTHASTFAIAHAYSSE